VLSKRLKPFTRLHGITSQTTISLSSKVLSMFVCEVMYSPIFEHMVLKKFLMLNRQKVASERRKLHNERFHYLCSLLGTIRVVTSEKVSSISRLEKYVNIFVGNSKGKCFVSDMDADRRLLLQRILNMWCINMEWIKPAHHRDQ